ncbi:MAG: F0F1 ATP synthase subunit gamma [Bacilli bacterium]|nr:F0F1 ATP synthase subunit gamma [Bacilli bacterium]
MNLLKIQRRIRNLNNINKISNIMFLLSLIKLKKCKEQLLENEFFNSSINEILKKTASLSTAYQKNILNNKKNNHLFVVITSNNGFCGNYNKNIINYVHKNIKANSNILIIGQNGYNILKKLDYKIFDDFVAYDNNFLNLSKEIIFFAEKNDFQKVNIIFSKNTNLFSNVICNDQILPIVFEKNNNDVAGDDSLILIEPNKEEIFNKTIPFYIANNIYKKILIAKISEQTIRINTMREAKQNTEKMIFDLKNQFNKIRHLKITQEILENSISSLLLRGKN